MSSLQVGAADPGAQPPRSVDILPFVAAVKAMWPGQPVSGTPHQIWTVRPHDGPNHLGFVAGPAGRAAA